MSEPTYSFDGKPFPELLIGQRGPELRLPKPLKGAVKSVGPNGNIVWYTTSSRTSGHSTGTDDIYSGGVIELECQASSGGGREAQFHAWGLGEWHSNELSLSFFGGWRDSRACGWGIYTNNWREIQPGLTNPALVRELSPPIGEVKAEEASLRYEGGFEGGYFHGYGTLSWPLTGESYEGTWQAGWRSGSGKYTRHDKTISIWDSVPVGPLGVCVEKDKSLLLAERKLGSLEDNGSGSQLTITMKRSSVLDELLYAPIWCWYVVAAFLAGGIWEKLRSLW